MDELLADHVNVRKLREYLTERGAYILRHGTRSLMEHLEGVHLILIEAKSEEVVCNAGLFHSVYGTFVYRTKLIENSEREKVQAMIGLRAEELVWTFCSLPRPNILEMSLNCENHNWFSEKVECRHSTHKQLWSDLLRLECANMLEQSALQRFPSLGRHAQSIGIVDAEGFRV